MPHLCRSPFPNHRTSWVLGVKITELRERTTLRARGNWISRPRSMQQTAPPLSMEAPKFILIFCVNPTGNGTEKYCEGKIAGIAPAQSTNIGPASCKHQLGTCVRAISVAVVAACIKSQAALIFRTSLLIRRIWMAYIVVSAISVQRALNF